MPNNIVDMQQNNACVDKQSNIVEIPGLGSAEGRWLRLGPWYAMFPVEFAFQQICKYTDKSSSILDPFCGRGTTLAASAALGRHAGGMEINPVAWIYAKTKLNPAPEGMVMSRLYELAWQCEKQKLTRMPDFFHWAFDKEVLRFLIVARENLNWRYNNTDRTLMAIILVDLHGKEQTSLSNQMMQTKAMAPKYSVNWWKQRDMRPREKDAIEILKNKIAWRYKHGLPEYKSHLSVYLGDSTSQLSKLDHGKKYDLLLTSPPYYGLTNYNADQWLRRWVLGGANRPINSAGIWESRFGNMKEYRVLLQKVFTRASKLLKRKSRIVVRTDARAFTYQTTCDVLKDVFCNKNICVINRPMEGKSQTALYGDKEDKPGEKDIILW